MNKTWIIALLFVFVIALVVWVSYINQVLTDFILKYNRLVEKFNDYVLGTNYKDKTYKLPPGIQKVEESI
mgnify:CR=1 FL=1